MRKRRVFTPALLRNFVESGRGLGIFEGYVPWHRVSRIDPPSRGQSRIHHFPIVKRQVELLSDNEFKTFCFITMLPRLSDVREQFPLSLHPARHEIYTYSYRPPKGLFPGTLEIAEGLGIRHPKVRSHRIEANWILSTDFLVALDSGTRTKLIAISVKSDTGQLSRRTKELQLLEREYWTSRKVDWYLITPQTYDPAVANTLRTHAPWGLADPVDEHLLERCRDYADLIHGQSLPAVLTLLQQELKVTQSIAQKVFWQSVWTGRLPIDLRRRPTPFAPFHVIPLKQFWAYNPIAMGRTVCL